MDELSEDDRLTVARARKIERFLSQPFFVAEVFTGSPGKLVSLEDTIKGFKGLCAGELRITCRKSPSTWSAPWTKPSRRPSVSLPRPPNRKGSPLMAETLKFELVSPERLLMSSSVRQVTVPGSEGEFGVLPNHAPVLSTLRPGIISVEGEDGKEDRIFVRGGFAEVNPAGLTVLAEQAIHMDDLDAEALAEQVRNAEEDVADATDDAKRQKAQETLDQLKQLQSAL